MKFIIGLLCLILSLSGSAQALGPSTAFIYSEPPDQVLYTYDWIIVDPSTFTPEKVKERFYLQKRGKLIAYFSLCETTFNKRIKKNWIIGKNKTWNSLIVDLRNRKLFGHLIKKAKLLLKNYDGIFLDTLDSYQIVLPKEKWKSYEKAEIRFIRLLRKHYPEKVIIINRGFEIYPAVKDCVDAVVVESLYRGLDQNLNYTTIREKERQWLLKKLKEIKKEKPVIVIDYLPPEKKEKARILAKKLIEEGFIPWISDKNLKEVGEGIFHILRRKILLIYDPAINIPDESDIHRIVQPILEWLGYEPEVISVKEFSKKHLTPEVKGIVVWNILKNKDKKKTVNLLLEARKKGIKTFIIDASIFPDTAIEKLGINIIPSKKSGEVPRIVYTGRTYGFEIEAFPSPTDTFLRPKGKFIPLLILKNSSGQEFIPVALTSWGGYGYSGYLLKDIFNDSLWIFDPFWLFSKVFGKLPIIPDITTESGRRILTVHLDGDGFVESSLVEKNKLTGEVLRDKIFKVYKIPHTVSVIVGELDPKGMYPDKSKKLIKIARSIFSLQNIEPASHTYAHPFSWSDVYKMSIGLQPDTGKHPKYGYHLPIPNYTPDIKKEIDYSVKFINDNLLPSKKRVRVFLWSGDCAPPPPVVKKTYKLGIYNVNGGDTTIDSTFPYLCRVSPMGINKGNYFQVYAPIQNEEVFTKNWTVKDGYVRVISTFKLTEKPKRLKPISIYYHFYSAQYPISFNALERVYRWATSQETIPMYLSDYAQRVLEFRGASIAVSNADGSIYFCSSGNLKTVRMKESEVIPSIENSTGVVGYRKINGELYLALDNSRCRKITFTTTDNNDFVLISSNGMVTEFIEETGHYRLKLESKVTPLEAELRISKHCLLKVNGKAKTIKNGRLVKIESQERKISLEAVCKH